MWLSGSAVSLTSPILSWLMLGSPLCGVLRSGKVVCSPDVLSLELQVLVSLSFVKLDWIELSEPEVLSSQVLEHRSHGPGVACAPAVAFQSCVWGNHQKQQMRIAVPLCRWKLGVRGGLEAKT